MRSLFLRRTRLHHNVVVWASGLDNVHTPEFGASITPQPYHYPKGLSERCRHETVLKFHPRLGGSFS